MLYFDLYNLIGLFIKELILNLFQNNNLEINFIIKIKPQSFLLI